MKLGKKAYSKLLEEAGVAELNDHDYSVIDAMENFGGSFVQALAVCFRRADRDNFAKLKITFPDYWKQYSDLAAKKGAKNGQ